MAAKILQINSVIPRFGDKSERVAELQIALNKRGASLIVDGRFGPMTKAAVSKYQKARGLPGSGIIGSQTMKYLGLSITEATAPVTVKGKTANHLILINGSKELGVKEAKGKKSNPRIELYHAYATIENKKGMSDDIAWCSSVNCYIVEISGFESTNNKMARSWEKGWGVRIAIGSGLPGDIVTFYRNGKSSGQGHVGIFVKEDKNYVWVMGGNQNDEFNITRYSKERVTGYWRHKSSNLTPAHVVELKAMAEKLIAGKKIATGGSVA